MPRDTRAHSNPAVSAGDILEARLAQVWFWEGAFVRRGINLQRHFHPDPLLVTDLDMLAIDVDTALGLRRTIGEAKSGKSKNTPKPLDRIIWLRGLMQVTGAERAELTSEIVPSLRVRELGHSLGVHAQSVDDLERRETNLRITDVENLATFGAKWAGELNTLRKTCATEAELERTYWFLRSEVWFLDPFSALKQTITALRALARRWTPQARDDHEFAVRWLVSEATVVATLNLVAIAGHGIRLSGDRLEEFINERMAEGSVPMHHMRAMSKSFDTYLAGVLRELGTPSSAVVQAMGAFEPRAPSYVLAVVELVRRLSIGATHARHLPRWVDVMCFERMVREREPTTFVVERLACPEPAKVAHAGRLVGSFLRGQADLPEAFASALGAVPSAATGSATPPGEDSGIAAAKGPPPSPDERNGTSGQMSLSPGDLKEGQ